MIAVASQGLGFFAFDKLKKTSQSPGCSSSSLLPYSLLLSLWDIKNQYWAAFKEVGYRIRMQNLLLQTWNPSMNSSIKLSQIPQLNSTKTKEWNLN